MNIKIKINKTTLELCQGDITKQKVDAIVNAANSRLSGGGGVDGAIHMAGGPAIMEECNTLNGCPTGTAVITTAGNLSAKYVIHAVGPVYRGGNYGEPELLKSAFRNSLSIADEHGVQSIAFPSISTGVYGYPIKIASKLALSTVNDYVKQQTGIERVVFVLFSGQDFETYNESRKTRKIS